MSFTSPFYLPFLILVAALVVVVRRWGRTPLLVLVVASFGFYATWNPWYCLALGMTATLDFAVGRALGQSRSQLARRLLLATSLTCNLGLLWMLKYFNLLVESIGSLAGPASGAETAVPFRLVFAVGISFYTFQSASYVIDVYRGDQEPVQSWLGYLAFVSFFPTLLAGPITRAETLVPQLERLSEPRDPTRGCTGLYLLATGLTKKALADFLALNLVNRVFELPGMYSSLEVLAGIYAYAVQIYLDFSGYSDIAIGSAALLGIGLKDNFNSPYRSRDLAEFWRRWHISLSTWLRDYLYFALPGKRPGSPWPYLNLVITFAIGGLWHGASWTYLLWGGIHGLGLAVVRLQGSRRTASGAGWKQVISVLLTFHFVAASWILFRCTTLTQAADVLARLGRLSLTTANLPAAVVLVILVVLACQFLPERIGKEMQARFVTAPVVAQAAVLLTLGAAFRLLGTSAPSPFIYLAY